MSAPLNLLPPFVSTRRFARALGAMLFLCAALAWMGAGFQFGEMRLAESLAQGDALAGARREAHALVGWLLAVAQGTFFAATGTLLMVFLHRARVNTRALGVRRLVYGRHWTVLGFLVPVLNAVRPYAVIREIWRASDPACTDPFLWRGRPAPPLLSLWWGSVLAACVLALVSSLLHAVVTGLPRIELAYGLAMAAEVCAAVGASLAYFVVQGLSEAQQAKREAVGEAPATAAAVFDPRDAAVGT